jgi:1-phosphatidylinositol phosphodiesterase
VLLSSIRCSRSLIRKFARYNISSFLSIPEKTQLSIQLLLPPPVNIDRPVLSITYFSAASFPLATPPVVSTGFGWPSFGFGVEGVNSRVCHFLLAALKEDWMLRAWTLMDFYSQPTGSDVVPLLVECNFKGRKSGILTEPTRGLSCTSILYFPFHINLQGIVDRLSQWVSKQDRESRTPCPKPQL